MAYTVNYVSILWFTDQKKSFTVDTPKIHSMTDCLVCICIYQEERLLEASAATEGKSSHLSIDDIAPV